MLSVLVGIMVTSRVQVAPWSETCGALLMPKVKVVAGVVALFLEQNMAMLALFSQVSGSPAKQPQHAFRFQVLEGKNIWRTSLGSRQQQGQHVHRRRRRR